MAQTWADFIQTGRYKGVAFDFLSSDDTFSRDVDRQAFPNRTGEFLEDRQLRAQGIQVAAIFFEDSYPEGLQAFLAAVKSSGPGELVHPIFGTLTALAENVVVHHDGEDGVDSATVQVTFIEHTDLARGPIVDTASVAALANAVRGQADVVTSAAAAQLDALSGASPSSSAVLAGAASSAQTLASTASSTADDLEADGDSMSLVEVQGRVNGFLSQVSSTVDDIGDYADPTTYSLASSLSGLAASMQLLAARVIETKPPLIQFQVGVDASLRAIAFERYGDGDRADELLQLNVTLIPDPLLIKSGTALRGYAR